MISKNGGELKFNLIILEKNNLDSKFLKNLKRNKNTIDYLKKIKKKYKNKPEYYNFNFLNDKIMNKPQLELELFKRERLNKFCIQTGLEKNQVKVYRSSHLSCLLWLLLIIFEWKRLFNFYHRWWWRWLQSNIMVDQKWEIKTSN